jgi:hypothetical protein
MSSPDYPPKPTEFARINDQCKAVGQHYQQGEMAAGEALATLELLRADAVRLPAEDDRSLLLGRIYATSLTIRRG